MPKPVTTKGTDAEFIRSLKYQDVLPHEEACLRKNERLERIAQCLEGITCPNNQ